MKPITDKSAEYEYLIQELREQAKQDHTIIIRVENKVTELENEVSSLREEKNQLQDNCSRLFDDNINKDAQVENWKHRYKVLMNQNEQLDKENKTMRELIRQWA